jgi:group I intron endonuclease
LICNKCERNLPIEDFLKNKKYKSGYAKICKECNRKYYNERNKKVRENAPKAIYKLVNIINNKVYVGSAVDLDKRINEHFYKLGMNKHENSYLQRSYNKYGKENFKWEVIEYVKDKNMLIEREQYWIDKLQPYRKDIGYNLSPSANSNLGFKHSEETKLQISINTSGIKNHHYGKPMAEKTKLKLSESQKGKKHWHYGWPLSQEHKENLSKTKKMPEHNTTGYKASEQTKQKMSIARQGEKNYYSKLKNVEVIQIKKMLHEGYKNIEIARIFNISPYTISDIKRGKSWQHINLDCEENYEKAMECSQ